MYNHQVFCNHLSIFVYSTLTNIKKNYLVLFLSSDQLRLTFMSQRLATTTFSDG